MPPGSYVAWGAVHFCTPLNRTGEQILTDEKSGVEIEKRRFYDLILKIMVETLGRNVFFLG